MSNRSYFEEDDNIIELKAQDFWEARQYNILRANPICSDPDHPGCDNCMGDEDDN